MVADFERDEVLERLAQAMDAPLTPTGSQLALDLLDRFADSISELWVNVANKILQTLSDAERHDTLAVTIDRRVAIWFVVWPGSHREVQPARIGEYLQQIAGKTKLLVEAGVSLEAFLEIDVYVSDRRSEGSPASDGRDLGVEVEYSFIPAKLVGGSDPSNPQWMTVMLNPDLLTPAERQTLGKLMA